MGPLDPGPHNRAEGALDRKQAVYFRSLRRLVFLGLAATMAVAATVLLLWEVLFHTLGFVSGSLQWPYVLRGFSTSLLIAGFAAAFFWDARRRLDKEWEEIRRRKAALQELAQCEDDSMGLAALSRALAHELRGPLHAISLRAAMVRKAAQALPGNEVVVELARTIEAEAAQTNARLGSYVERAGDATRSLRRERVDLAALLRLAAGELAPLAEARGVRLELPPEGSLGPVCGDPLLLQRALRVLVRGAVEAAQAGTAVGLRTSVSGGAAVLTLFKGRVDDAGALFGKAGEPGAARAALGLALVRDVARAHGGELVLASAETGSAITFRLPVGT
jgi:signal transduction histidine kinase